MNKSSVKIFSEKYTNNLLTDLRRGTSLSLYFQNDFIYNEDYPPGKSLVEMDESFDLLTPTELDLFDVENSIRLYENLKMNEEQASDARLWIYLTHVHFWKYMKIRWNDIEKYKDFETSKESKRKLINYIEEHWFLKTSNDRWLRRNGISRLWWFAHLTYDRHREDPYELTRILLNTQDIAQSLLERSFGRNRKVLHIFLEYIKENITNSSRERVRDLSKRLNMLGGVKLLTILNKDEVFNYFNAFVV